MKRFILQNINRMTCTEKIRTYTKSYIKVYRQVLKKARRIAIRKELIKASKSSKAIWQVVNRHRNKKPKCESKRDILLKVDNKIISNPQEIVDIFSNTFDKPETVDEIDSFEQALKNLRDSVNRVDKEMTCELVTAYEIRKLVNSMAIKKSSGHDEISIQTIKDHIDILAGPLAHLINKCINMSIFPEQLKIARVLPIYKKGCKLEPNNYRPISLLPIISKIFEKILKMRLLGHLNRNKILNHNQFGYQKNVGTSDAINSLMEKVVSGINDKLIVVGLFLDLSSAFDTVNHKLLLKKMEHYGVRGPVLNLFKSYLENRKQYVEIKVKEEICEKVYKARLKLIKQGVPQGSILGSILFILFVNDLINFMLKINDTELVLFADDTNAIIAAKDLDTLSNKVNKALTLFHSWFGINNLKLNASKTNAILFRTTSRNKETMDIKVNNDQITLVDSVKFLGMYIDESLNWKKELAAIESSISSACYALRSLRDLIDIDQLKVVYYSLVESKLRYSIALWGGSYAYNLNTAFVIQKRAIRTMVRIPQWVSCKEYFKELHILTVPCLYILVVLTDLLKKLYNIETLEERTKREATRRRDLQYEIQPHLDVVSHAAAYQSVKLFNKLPIQFKSIYNLTQFKLQLKSFLIDKCYYTLDEFLCDTHT